LILEQRSTKPIRIEGQVYSLSSFGFQHGLGASTSVTVHPSCPSGFRDRLWVGFSLGLHFQDRNLSWQNTWTSSTFNRFIPTIMFNLLTLVKGVVHLKMVPIFYLLLCQKIHTGLKQLKGE